MLEGAPTPWAGPRLCHMNAHVCENRQRLTITVPILQMGKVRHRVRGVRGAGMSLPSPRPGGGFQREAQGSRATGPTQSSPASSWDENECVTGEAVLNGGQDLSEPAVHSQASRAPGNSAGSSPPQIHVTTESAQSRPQHQLLGPLLGSHWPRPESRAQGGRTPGLHFRSDPQTSPRQCSPCGRGSWLGPASMELPPPPAARAPRNTAPALRAESPQRLLGITSHLPPFAGCPLL